MKLKLKKIANGHLKLFARHFKKASKKVVLQNAYSRLIRRYARMEAGLAIKKGLVQATFQFKIRPRLKLAIVVLLVLVLAQFGSEYASGYLHSKENEIKVNGQPILVAAKSADSQKSEADVEISAVVSARISPFDYKYPVENGRISQGYSSYHRAYDIATALGNEITPIGSGIVEYAGFVPDGKGNIVIVDHGDGLKSIYAHMGKIDVGLGNMVNGKSGLGTVGLTGHTTGPHVHLELYDKGVAVNPGSVLPR